MRERENVDDSSGLLLTLARGLRVLEGVAQEHGRVTARALATRLGIKLGACYQTLKTLQALGYVERLPGGRYGLGSRVGLLVEHYESDSATPQPLLDILNELHQAVGESVYVAMRRHRKVRIVAFLEGTRALRVGNLSVGYGDHPHARASSKALLAFSDQEVVEELLEGHRLDRVTEHTITDWRRLLEDLDATRRRGYAIDNEEFSLGVACIGAVVLDASGRAVGAYGSSFPVSRLGPDERLLAHEVMRAADHASRALGYVGAYPPPVMSAAVEPGSELVAQHAI